MTQKSESNNEESRLSGTSKKVTTRPTRAKSAKQKPKDDIVEIHPNEDDNGESPASSASSQSSDEDG